MSTSKLQGNRMEVSLASICPVGFHALSMSKVEDATDKLTREVSWAGALPVHRCTAAYESLLAGYCLSSF